MAWANETAAKEEHKVKSFKDKSIATGQWLIDLCAGIEPRAVNWDIVTPGETDEDKELNAKYAISLARKFGAVIFCVWEDMVKVNPKQILVFICSLNQCANEMKKEE